MKISIINGPNLNLVGVREPEIYGNQSLDEYLQTLVKQYPDVQFSLFQSNHEGAIIDEIQRVGFTSQGIAINAGAYTHYSIAIADALRAGDVDDAEDRATEVYARKTDCTAQNLADLTITYHQLTQRATDAVSRYDYVLKAIDCHKSAVAKDADDAANRYRSAGYNMDAIIADYKAHLSDYRNAVSESMNF